MATGWRWASCEHGSPGAAPLGESLPSPAGPVLWTCSALAALRHQVQAWGRGTATSGERHRACPDHPPRGTEPRNLWKETWAEAGSLTRPTPGPMHRAPEAGPEQQIWYLFNPLCHLGRYIQTGRTPHPERPTNWFEVGSERWCVPESALTRGWDEECWLP